MKRIYSILLLLLVTNIFLLAQIKQTLYFDFGPNDAINGNSTVGQDINGNYWNNITNTYANSSTQLINSKNISTGYTLTIIKNMSSNGILNGGLLFPLVSKLNDLAVPTATQDFFYVSTDLPGKIKITGLNTSHCYRFYFFGSRDVSDVRVTKYSITGSDAYSGTLQTSGKDLGGIGINYNDIKYFTDIISPNSNNEITIDITSEKGIYAYINLMKIEEFYNVNTNSINVTGDDINIMDGCSQMNVIYSPLDATSKHIDWSVEDTSIAKINSSGLLKAYKNGIVKVTASINQNGEIISSDKLVKIQHQYTEMYVGGSATVNGEGQASALQMNNVVGLNGAQRGAFELETTLNNVGTIKFYESRSDTSKSFFGGGEIYGTVQLNGLNINPIEKGKVLIRLNLITNTFKIFKIDPLKISQMGSSVSYGTGATSFQGYAYLYNQLLSQRYLSNLGSDWRVSNISVPGNSTVDVLNRWDNDLLGDCSSYVIYALSLGNEGLLEGGQPIYDQFLRNLRLLIDKARSAGKIPIITNTYPKQTFTEKEYNFVKQANLLIHEWDVPSVNLLGAIDFGVGIWPLEFMVQDGLHPNDKGHNELFYTIVPSLFDAIKLGKPLPEKQKGTYMSFQSTLPVDRLSFTPENIIHSFTTTFDIRTNSTGKISSFVNLNSIEIGLIQINSTGCINYTSQNGILNGDKIINDGQWHKISLTHYYAKGETLLYADTIFIGKINEKLLVNTLFLNDKNAPKSIDYRDWMFFRSGMNSMEISALNSGEMLKSSLELYSPLDSQANNTLINLAQSTNSIKRVQLVTNRTNDLTSEGINIYPDPTSNKLFILENIENEIYNYTIYTIDGKVAIKTSKLNNNELDVSGLRAGFYTISFYDIIKNECIKRKFVKI